MAVLLIGSTGMGKSAFGNFLLNPDDDDHIFDSAKQTFTVSTNNKPMTQEVQIAHKEVHVEGILTDSMSLNVIDTPGLNESAEQDLSHMIDIVKKLNEIGQIQACILVIKFSASIIDSQYKATVEYYSRLLPGLFDNNVIIVMTDFATDDRSEKLRRKKKIDVEAIKRNTVLELSKCSNGQITYSPIIFMLDCMPCDDDQSVAEIEKSKNVRNAILQYIYHLKPVDLKNCKIAKTPYLKELDNGRIRELEGEIKGYNQALQESHKGSNNALNEMQEKQTEIVKAQGQLKNLEQHRDERNKKDPVLLKQLSIEESWKILRWFTEKFNIDTTDHNCDVIHFETWTNRHSEFKEIVQGKRSVSGKVEGEFMRGIYASIKVYTEKRQKYAKEITQLNGEIEKAKKKLAKCIEARDEMKQQYDGHMEEMQRLKKYIDEKSKEIEECSLDLMTVEVALARLNKLKPSC